MGEDIRKKMISLNSLFKAAENVGDVLEHKTACIKRACVPSDDDYVFSSSDKPRVKDLNAVADFLELADVSIRLWQQLKKRR